MTDFAGPTDLPTPLDLDLARRVAQGLEQLS
jgi:hypothetical protein